MCNILHPASDPLCKASDSQAMMTYLEMAAVIPAAGCLPHLSLLEVFICTVKVAELFGRQLLNQHGSQTSNINRKTGAGFGSP